MSNEPNGPHEPTHGRPGPYDSPSPDGWGGGGYDAEATAFVQLPGNGLPGTDGYQNFNGESPLAAPGTGQGGYTPPSMDASATGGYAEPTAPMTPSATTDPAATGQWTMPFAPSTGDPAGVAGAVGGADWSGNDWSGGWTGAGSGSGPGDEPFMDGRAVDPEIGTAVSAPPPGGHAPGDGHPETGTPGGPLHGTSAALAMGQGAAAALAGSHDARTQRRPLGSGGAAASGADTGAEASYGQNGPYEQQDFPGQGFPAQGSPGQGFPEQQGHPEQQGRPDHGFPEQGFPEHGAAGQQGQHEFPGQGAAPVQQGAGAGVGPEGVSWPTAPVQPPGWGAEQEAQLADSMARRQVPFDAAPGSPLGQPAAPAAPGIADGGPGGDDARWTRVSPAEPSGPAATEAAAGAAGGAPPGARLDTESPTPGGGPVPGDDWGTIPGSTTPWSGAFSPGGGSDDSGEFVTSPLLPGQDTGPAAEAPEASPREAAPGPDTAEALYPDVTIEPADSGPGTDEDPGTGTAGTDDGFGDGTGEATASANASANATDPAGAPEDGHPGHPGLGGPETDAAAALPTTVSEHPHTSYVLHVNGADRPVTEAWIGESLLYVLRERLGLAGAKDGCSQGECGACSVQVDGRLVASCLVPAATAAGSEVRTVEGLASEGSPSDVQRALTDCGAVQCGFCVPGLAMTVHDLLAGNHTPSELETRRAISGNLCRCSGYSGVLEAVRTVAAERSAKAAREAAEHQAAQEAPPPAGDGAPPGQGAHGSQGPHGPHGDGSHGPHGDGSRPPHIPHQAHPGEGGAYSSGGGGA